MTDLPPDITNDPRYRRVHDERERSAAEARGSQAFHLRTTRIFILATAAAAITGGLLLYGIEAKADPSRWLVDQLANGTVKITLAVVQGLCLAAAAGSGYILGARDPRKRWIEARLRAEEGRLLLASRALTIGHALGPDAFRKAGAWFADFIEEQRGHLDASARRRDRSALRLVFLGAILAGLAALAGGLAGIDQSFVVVLLAVFGVSAPALVAAVESWGKAAADAKRAELHAGSWSALSALLDDLPAFEAAVQANDLGAATAFAERVFEVLRRDHAGFAAVQGEAVVAAANV